MAGEGKFGLNIEAVYVHTDDGPVPLLDYLEQSGGDVSVAWGDVTGKPARFAPDTHTHAVGDVDGLTADLNDKANAGALEAVESRVTTVEGDLDGKADASALADLTARVEALENAGA